MRVVCCWLVVGKVVVTGGSGGVSVPRANTNLMECFSRRDLKPGLSPRRVVITAIVMTVLYFMLECST